jgi:hypothetical protein
MTYDEAYDREEVYSPADDYDYSDEEYEYLYWLVTELEFYETHERVQP